MLSFALVHGRTALIAVSLAAAAQAQVGLGLSPMRQEIALAPGSQHSGVLTLVNDAGAHMRVLAEVLDFYLDEAATPQFKLQAPSEAACSCRQWMVVNPMEMELRGADQVKARYTIRVPRTVPEGSYHCAIGFRTVPTAEQITQTGIRNAVQIVSAFYAVVGKPPIEGTVKNLKLLSRTTPEGNQWNAVLVLANPGLMHYRPTGSVEVLDAAGAVLEKRELQSIPVLPKRDQNLFVPLELRNGPGRYTLRARVDIGGSEIQEASAVVMAEAPAARK